MDVAIIGAGVAGLTCACEAVDRGMRVTLFDQSPRAGEDSCSRLAGGMLAPWCEGESAEPTVVSLGTESAAWWERHVDGVSRNGTLVVASKRDQADLRRFSRLTDHHRWLESGDIVDLEPDLEGRFSSALYFEEEAHLSPRAALQQLLDYLAERGANIECGQRVTPAELKADVVIDCRGYQARESLSGLRGVRGEMVVVRTTEIALNRPVRFLHPRIPVYVSPWGDDQYMIGATMIENEGRGGITVRSSLELLSAAFAIHPLFGEAEVVECGADVRPAYADNVPRVSHTGNVIHVNGMYRHGFLLGPAMARQAADRVTDIIQ